jgi:hypothetical protein
MGRPMSPERETEFAELQRFLAHFATRVMGLDRAQSSHPSNALSEIATKFGKSKALDGLRQAIGDCIEMTQDRTRDWVQRFDEECVALGLVTLSQLRVRYWSKYKAILKRGRIKDETEYYLVAGIANDLSAPISAADRAMLERLLRQFEERVS